MEDKIKQTMASVFEVNTSDIREDASNKTLPNWDSLRHMSLIIALEEEFDVEFDNEEIVEAMTLQSIITILRNKLG